MLYKGKFWLKPPEMGACLLSSALLTGRKALPPWQVMGGRVRNPLRLEVAAAEEAESRCLRLIYI